MISTKAIYVSLILNVASIALGVLVFKLMQPIETVADLAWMFVVIAVGGFALGTLATLMVLRLQRPDQSEH